IRYLEELFPSGPLNAIGDALIEAPIVHLRLFDSFFKAKKLPTDNDDMVALHWNPNWTPQDVLTGSERDETNHHAHLVHSRGTAQPWPPSLPRLALRFCDIFDAFVTGLPPARATAFAPTNGEVAAYRTWMNTR